MSKVIAFRVSDEVYSFFEEIKKKEKDAFISDTFRRVFGLYNRYDKLKLSRYDKAWVSMTIITKVISDLAFALIEKTKSESPRPQQYDWVASNINMLRTTYATIQDEIDVAEGRAFSDREEANLIDSATLISIVLTESTKREFTMNKLVNVLRREFNAELQQYN
jgi:hypothetical protein